MRQNSFNTIAHNYDSLRPVNESILKALIVKALSVISARSILDVCCGTGRYSIEIAKRLNLHLVGIDKSHKMIDEAMVKYPRAEWICGDILKILKNLVTIQQKNTSDVIFLLDKGFG
jgi:ubiquinone/menaquinone biosynthesis C-methylase UbiE